MTTGRILSSMPLSRSGPDTGLPVNWFHSESVSRSNISLFERYKNPDEPKISGFSRGGARVSKRMPDPQSVQ